MSSRVCIPESHIWVTLKESFVHQLLSLSEEDRGFPGRTGKELRANAGGDPWVREIPWSRKWQLRYSYLETHIDRKPGRLQSIVLQSRTRLSNWACGHSTRHTAHTHARTHTHTVASWSLPLCFWVTYTWHLPASEDIWQTPRAGSEKSVYCLRWGAIQYKVSLHMNRAFYCSLTGIRDEVVGETVCIVWYLHKL